MENNLEAWCERLLEMQFEVGPRLVCFQNELTEVA